MFKKYLMPAVWIYGWQCWSVGKPFWSKLKYFNNYWKDCWISFTDIHGVQSLNPRNLSCKPLTFPLAPSSGQNSLVCD